ncbi:hypothetical protein, partial [Xenorhabdus bovienii]|uniref:hypothetical protein n=1 Tax=Xenorhabdus bovienii TaxID=40576 RepID=UPI001E384B78
SPERNTLPAYRSQGGGDHLINRLAKNSLFCDRAHKINTIMILSKLLPIFLFLSHDVTKKTPFMDKH